MSIISTNNELPTFCKTLSINSGESSGPESPCLHVMAANELPVEANTSQVGQDILNSPSEGYDPSPISQSISCNTSSSCSTNTLFSPLNFLSPSESSHSPSSDDEGGHSLRSPLTLHSFKEDEGSDDCKTPTMECTVVELGSFSFTEDAESSRFVLSLPHRGLALPLSKENDDTGRTLSLLADDDENDGGMIAIMDDENDGMIAIIDDEIPTIQCSAMDPEIGPVVQPKNLLFQAIVQSLNSKDGKYKLESMNSKTSNDVYLIRDTSGIPVAVFKTTKVVGESGEGKRQGVGNGTEFAFQNEVIASKIGSLWSEKFIPEAEIVKLKVDKLKEGTMHEFVNGASLKTEAEIKTGPKEKAAQSEKNNKIFYNVDFDENSSPQNLSNLNGLRTQDIMAFHIATVSLDVNPGNIMVSEDGFPTAIDHNEIAPHELKNGIKPPCWMQCPVALKPFTDNTKKWRSLEWSAIKEAIQSVEGHSEEGLITMQNGHTLLRTGIENGLTPNQMAYFLIGIKTFNNTGRSPPPLKYCLNKNGLVDELKLKSAMNEIKTIHGNDIDYASMNYRTREIHIDKIVLELKNFIEPTVANKDSVGASDD